MYQYIRFFHRALQLHYYCTLVANKTKARTIQSLWYCTICLHQHCYHPLRTVTYCWATLTYLLILPSYPGKMLRWSKLSGLRLVCTNVTWAACFNWLLWRPLVVRGAGQKWGLWWCDVIGSISSCWFFLNSICSFSRLQISSSDLPSVLSHSWATGRASGL